MKLILDKKAKNSVRVAVTSTTTGQELTTHDMDAGGEVDLGDMDDETRIVITRGAATPMSDEDAADKKAPKK